MRSAEQGMLQIKLRLERCGTVVSSRLRNFSKEGILRYRKGLEKLNQHLITLQLQLWISPTVFKKQVLPSLLNEGLALRTLNCNLHIYKSFAQLFYEEGWMAELFAAEVRPFKLQPSVAHMFNEEHLYSLLTLPDRTGDANPSRCRHWIQRISQSASHRCFTG